MKRSYTKVSYKRKDGSKSYRKTIRMSDGVKQENFTRIEDANKWYANKLRDKELFRAGISPEIKVVSFGDYAREWIKKREESGNPTWRQDSSRLRTYYIPILEDTVLSSINPEKWEYIFQRISDSQCFSNATYNRHRSLIHKIYNDAIKKSKAAVFNPIASVERRHEGTKPAWDYFASPLEIK